MPASKSKSTTKKASESTASGAKLPEKIELRDALISLHPSKRKTIKKIKIVLSGSLGINNLDQSIEGLLPVFDQFDYLDFQLKEITTLDLSYIQLLYHFKSTYADNGKTVTIYSDLSNDLRKIIVHAGFEELMFIPKLV